MSAKKTYVTADELRQSIIDRATELAKVTGKSKADIGRDAVGDCAFLWGVGKGRNFGIDIYERFHVYADKTIAKQRGKAAAS